MTQKNWSKTMIMNWHMNALPECTCPQQRIKSHREAREYYFAKRHGDKKAMLEEMADFYIVNIVLHMRYHDEAAKFVCERIESFKSFPRILQAVNEKMDITATRTFVWKNGEWRHDENFDS